MRNNGWKAKVLIVIAFIIGVIGGVTVALVLPGNFEKYRGLAAFGTIILISSVIVFVGVKCFHIGED